MSTQNLYGAIYQEITLEDGSIYRGELIEFYEDRWFYEDKNNELVQKYILLFEDTVIGPQFHLKNMKAVTSIRTTGYALSAYKQLLDSRGISLNTELVENQYILTGNSGHHKFEKMFGNFAWDIGLIDAEGKTFKNEGLSLQDYYVYSKPVLSPVSGVVVGLVRNNDDNQPDLSLSGDLSGKKNNYLTIKIDEDFYLSVVHFKKDSIHINLGDRIEAGDFLGTVGNSGVSYLPHLHYTLYIYNQELSRFISVPGIGYSRAFRDW